MADNSNYKAPITIRDAAILPGAWRNFSGRGDQFNREGTRVFNIGLPEDVALAVKAEGLNVKAKETDEGEVRYHLKVEASWKIKAPQIYLISGNSRTLLSEELVGILDDAEIVKADIVIDPSFYDINGRTGYKAYLKKAFITIEQDDLDREYQDIPISQGN